MSKKRLLSDEMFHDLGIIHGWKAIGQHIGRSARTARRWCDTYGLPVRRSIAGRPFALTFEINKWMLILDEKLRNNYPEIKEELKQHAAMMRSFKKKKTNV